MRVHVLGSAAGGGFPKRNCNCRNCAGSRQGTIRFTLVPQTSEASPCSPPCSPHRHAAHRADTIGVPVEDINTRKNLYYAPGLGHIEPHLRRFLEQSRCGAEHRRFVKPRYPAMQGVGMLT